MRKMHRNEINASTQGPKKNRVMAGVICITADFIAIVH